MELRNRDDTPDCNIEDLCVSFLWISSIASHRIPKAFTVCHHMVIL